MAEQRREHDLPPVVKEAIASYEISAPALLNAARRHMEDRAATYDKPEGERSMGAAVKAFNAITGYSLKESDGWLFMVCLKQVRLFTNTHKPHRDSAEDMISYAALLGECMLGGDHGKESNEP